MTHTVCGTTIQMVRALINEQPIIEIMLPHCPTCGLNVPDAELAPYPVSPGRPWELDDSGDEQC